MKLFNAIAAAAVIGASCVFTAPAQASVTIDLDTSKATFRNDSDSELYIQQDGLTATAGKEYKEGFIEGYISGIKKKHGEVVTLGNPLPSKYGKNGNFEVKLPAHLKVNAMNEFSRSSTAKSALSSRCPAGTSYQKIRVGGLIKRTAAEGCFTDFQASQLRMQANANQQQRLRDFQRNLNESIPSPVNCSGTVNNWGGGYNTYDATCY